MADFNLNNVNSQSKYALATHFIETFMDEIKQHVDEIAQLCESEKTMRTQIMTLALLDIHDSALDKTKNLADQTPFLEALKTSIKSPLKWHEWGRSPKEVPRHVRML